MYIERLTIQNFRCFDEVELTLAHPHAQNASKLRLPNVTLFLGNNGTGKSAILKAIVLTLLNNIAQIAGIDPYFFVRRQAIEKANTIDYAQLTSGIILDAHDVEQETEKNGALSTTSTNPVDEDELVAFLEGLTPSDFDRVLVRIPEAKGQVSIKASQFERAATLIRYMRSSSGPGMTRLARVVNETFPNKFTQQTNDIVPVKIEPRSFPLKTVSETSVELADSYERIRATVQNDIEVWRLLHNDSSDAFFSIGYGAGRRVQAGEFNPSERDRNRRLRYQRVAGLFENHYDLVPPYAWLSQARRTGRLREATALLKQLLPNGIEPELEGDDAPLFRRTKGAPLPYLTLSDGFRGYIGWVLDLLYHMDRVTPPEKKLADLTGVVMVDEIDLFLHPEWQRVVVPTVARAFPKLQFIFTTHSPIVAGTVQSENVWVTEWDDETSSARVRQPQESIFGLSADQILTGAYFGLTTTRAPDAESELDNLAERVMKGDREAGFAYLEKMAQGFEESKVP